MMDALNSLHRRALDATGKIVSGIGPGQSRPFLTG
jgi:hypothetical protein